MPCGGLLIGAETVVQFCQPPVGATSAEANVAPVGESIRSSTLPPAPPEATRKSTEVRFSKFIRLKKM